MTPEHLREDALRHFIAEARWFGGKGRDFEVAEVRDLSLADEVTTTLVTVRFDDGNELSIGPGDVVTIDPGHDAWTEGDEPCVLLDTGVKAYAKPS